MTPEISANRTDKGQTFEVYVRSQLAAPALIRKIGPASPATDTADLKIVTARLYDPLSGLTITGRLSGLVDGELGNGLPSATKVEVAKVTKLGPERAPELKTGRVEPADSVWQQRSHSETVGDVSDGVSNTGSVKAPRDRLNSQEVIDLEATHPAADQRKSSSNETVVPNRLDHGGSLSAEHVPQETDGDVSNLAQTLSRHPGQLRESAIAAPSLLEPKSAAILAERTASAVPERKHAASVQVEVPSPENRSRPGTGVEPSLTEPTASASGASQEVAPICQDTVQQNPVVAEEAATVVVTRLDDGSFTFEPLARAGASVQTSTAAAPAVVDTAIRKEASADQVSKPENNTAASPSSSGVSSQHGAAKSTNGLAPSSSLAEHHGGGTMGIEDEGQGSNQQRSAALKRSLDLSSASDDMPKKTQRVSSSQQTARQNSLLPSTESTAAVADLPSPIASTAGVSGSDEHSRSAVQGPDSPRGSMEEAGASSATATPITPEPPASTAETVQQVQSHAVAHAPPGPTNVVTESGGSQVVSEANGTSGSAEPTNGQSRGTTPSPAHHIPLAMGVHGITDGEAYVKLRGCVSAIVCLVRDRCGSISHEIRDDIRNEILQLFRSRWRAARALGPTSFSDGFWASRVNTMLNAKGPSMLKELVAFTQLIRTARRVAVEEGHVFARTNTLASTIGPEHIYNILVNVSKQPLTKAVLLALSDILEEISIVSVLFSNASKPLLGPGRLHSTIVLEGLHSLASRSTDPVCRARVIKVATLMQHGAVAEHRQLMQAKDNPTVPSNVVSSARLAQEAAVQQSPTQQSPAPPSPAPPSRVQPSSAPPSRTQPSSSQPSPAQQSSTQPLRAQSSSSQASRAQPSSSQPSPAQQSSAQKPYAQRPSSPGASTQQASVQQARAQQSSAREPSVQESFAQEPHAQTSSSQKRSSQNTLSRNSSTPKDSTRNASAQKPTAQKPSAVPSAQSSSTQKPTARKPSTQPPAQSSSAQKLTARKPSTQPPAQSSSAQKLTARKPSAQPAQPSSTQKPSARASDGESLGIAKDPNAAEPTAKLNNATREDRPRLPAGRDYSEASSSQPEKPTNSKTRKNVGQHVGESGADRRNSTETRVTSRDQKAGASQRGSDRAAGEKLAPVSSRAHRSKTNATMSAGPDTVTGANSEVNPKVGSKTEANAKSTSGGDKQASRPGSHGSRDLATREKPSRSSALSKPPVTGTKAPKSTGQTASQAAATAQKRSRGNSDAAKTASLDPGQREGKSREREASRARQPVDKTPVHGAAPQRTGETTSSSASDGRTPVAKTAAKQRGAFVPVKTRDGARRSVAAAGGAIPSTDPLSDRIPKRGMAQATQQRTDAAQYPSRPLDVAGGLMKAALQGSGTKEISIFLRTDSARPVTHEYNSRAPPRPGIRRLPNVDGASGSRSRGKRVSFMKLKGLSSPSNWVDATTQKTPVEMVCEIPSKEEEDVLNVPTEWDHDPLSPRAPPHHQAFVASRAQMMSRRSFLQLMMVRSEEIETAMRGDKSRPVGAYSTPLYVRPDTNATIDTDTERQWAVSGRDGGDEASGAYPEVFE